MHGRRRGAEPGRLTKYAMPISATMTMPIQKALKLPAVSPARMLSDAPPSRDAVTTSRTWRDSVDVKTLTSSGMIAPASVPHVMMARELPPERAVAEVAGSAGTTRRT